jgi:hypothetical protein
MQLHGMQYEVCCIVMLFFFCQDKVTAVHWSPVDNNLILIGDEKGGIVSWKPKKEEIVIYTPEKGCVSALACSLHDLWHVAIG